MRAVLPGVAIVLAVSLLAGFPDIEREKYASDEGMWIYISQKTWDLVRSGEWSGRAWENMDATWGYVNPPIAKYMLGCVLSAQNAEWTWKSGEVPPDPVLAAARRPSAVLGLIGCLAVLWIGWRALGRRAAVLAALALAASPLWISVSRHAMTDVYGVTIALLSVAAFLPALSELGGARRWRVLVPWVALSGVLSGLAVGAKLNAAPTPAALGALLLFLLGRELLTAPGGERLRGAGTIVALGTLFAASSVVTFVGLNPYLHEDAWNRFSGIIAFWRNMSEQRALRSAAGGFGNAFFPEEKGVRTLLGKFAFPLRSTAFLLAVPLVAGLAAWRVRRSAELGRLVGWLLLIPAAVTIALSRNQLTLAWIPWIGLLGAGVALLLSTRGEHAARTRPRLVWLIPVWATVITFFVWRMTFLPQTRYYLPLLPLVCVGAGYGLAVLRDDVSRTGGMWARRVVDAAILLGILSVLVTFPDHGDASVRKVLHGDAVLPRALHWGSVGGLALGILAGIGGLARSGLGRPPTP